MSRQCRRLKTERWIIWCRLSMGECKPYDIFHTKCSTCLLRIKGTTWFQFSCSWMVCSRTEGVRGLVDGVYTFYFDQGNGQKYTHTHCTTFLRRTLTLPPVHENVHIMVCKVFWEGEFLWQENCPPPIGRFFCFFLVLCQTHPTPLLFSLSKYCLAGCLTVTYLLKLKGGKASPEGVWSSWGTRADWKHLGVDSVKRAGRWLIVLFFHSLVCPLSVMFWWWWWPSNRPSFRCQ